MSNWKEKSTTWLTPPPSIVSKKHRTIKGLRFIKDHKRLEVHFQGQQELIREVLNMKKTPIHHTRCKKLLARNEGKKFK